MVLAFDEFVKLNKPNENIIITPQQESKPEVTSKNKKVFINFIDPLEDNTTYTITFNGAIQDLNEQNDSVFQYVFSTGNYIDSLTLQGQIIDGKTNLPDPGLLVGLYPIQKETQFDSIPYSIKPTYIAQSNTNGMFQFDYLKEGNYNLFAFKDKNRNLLIDPGERLAFYGDETISIKDSIPPIEMRSFIPSSSSCEIKEVYFQYPGKITISNSCPFNNFEIRSSILLIEEEINTDDSLIFWLSEPPKPRMEFILNNNGETDTLKPFYDGVPDKLELGNLKVTNNLTKGLLLPKENLEIEGDEAIREIDADGVHFYDSDSSEIKIDMQQTGPRKFEFKTFGTDAIQVIIDSAAIKSVGDNYNPEDINLSFENYDSTFYGNLKVNIDTVFNSPVIVELYDSKGILAHDTTFSNTIRYENMIPGEYQMILVIDENNDGEWTTGSIPERRAPEQRIIFTQKLIIKSKWDKEVDWVLKKSKTIGQ